jgi:hypothetical protein
MTLHYIDTSSLKWRYMSGNPSSSVNSIVDDSNNRIFTSELTVLELSNALASEYRDNKISQSEYVKHDSDFMSDIANDKLTIVPMTRSIERARYLINYVGVGLKRSLRTGDSIQVLTAIEVAATEQQVITFVTSDENLSKVLQSVSAFPPLLTTLYLPRN